MENKLMESPIKITFTEEALDEIERLNPEWLCPYCVEECKI